MKQPFVYSLVLGLFLFNSCGKSVYNSYPQPADIQIDGNSAEWPDSVLFLQNINDVQFATGWVNSDSMLCILINVYDRRLAQVFNRRGFTIWLDDKNKKQKHLGIRYTNHAVQRLLQSGELQARRFAADMPDRSQRRMPKGTFSLVIDADSSALLSGFQAGTGFEQGIVSFEFAVPLEEQDSLALSIAPERLVKIGFEIPPLPDEQVQRLKAMILERRQQRSVGFDGGSGAMSAGRPGGMRGMSGVDGMETWVSVRLAE